MNAHDKVGAAGMNGGRWLAGVLVFAVALMGARLAWLGASQVKPVAAPARIESPAKSAAVVGCAPPLAKLPETATGLARQPPIPPVMAPAAPPAVVPQTPQLAPAPASAAADEFARIPGGSFAMGNALAASGDGHSNELPQHRVQLSAFLLGRHEVTQALWNEVRAWGVGHGYTDLPPGLAKAAMHPVHSLDWYSLVKWCNACSEKAGVTPCYTVGGQIYRTGNRAPECQWSANGYRLPTEAEWETAARGGLSGLRFPWGDTISHREANFRNDGGETYQTGSTGDHPAAGTGAEPYTTPVGGFAANPYGLFDVAGNLAEWCWDWYGPYPAADLTNPRGAASGTLRVYRGGSWRHNASDCRVADRYYSYPGGSYDYVGFRLARSCAP